MVTAELCPLTKIFRSVGFDECEKAYRETSNHEYANECGIDKEFYLGLEKQGMFQGIGAFSDNRLVGFMGLQKIYYAHMNTWHTFIETVFVLPDFRKGNTFFKMLHLAKKWTKDEGHKSIMLSAPYGSRLERVYKRIATPTDTEFEISL